MTARALTLLAAVLVFAAAVVVALATYASSGGNDGLPDCAEESVVYPIPALVALTASGAGLWLSNRVRGWDRHAKLVTGLLALAVVSIAAGFVLAEAVRGEGCLGG